MVQRACLGGPVPSCPPTTAGIGTFYDGATRLPAVQAVLPGSTNNVTLQTFAVPEGENLIFHLWAYVMSASGQPATQIVLWHARFARADDGSLIELDGTEIANDGLNLVGGYNVVVAGPDTVDISGQQRPH